MPRNCWWVASEHMTCCGFLRGLGLVISRVISRATIVITFRGLITPLLLRGSWLDISRV